MATPKQVPLERDFKHWKEKYETEVRAHNTTRNNLQYQVLEWQAHAKLLGQLLMHLRTSSGWKP